jgi:hypothetical protein
LYGLIKEVDEETVVSHSKKELVIADVLGEIDDKGCAAQRNDHMEGKGYQGDADAVVLYGGEGEMADPEHLLQADGDDEKQDCR